MRTQHMLTVRISAELLKALDDEVGRIQKQRPGAQVQRSDVIREILGEKLLTPPTAAEDGDTTSSKGASAQHRQRGNILLWAESSGESATNTVRAAQADAIDQELRLTYWLRNGPHAIPASLVSEAVGSFLMDRAGEALSTSNARRALLDVVYRAPRAILAAVRELVRVGGAEEHGPNRLTALGNLLSAKFRQEILLHELEAQEWNLGEVAKQFGLQHGSSAVLRMIHDLGLTHEYEAARSEGLIRRGRPTGPSPK